MSEPALVHVHGGRLLLDRLAEAGVAGEFLEWCDVLCDGPTPAGLSADDWYDLRARYHEETTGPAQRIPHRDRLIAQDRALALLPGPREVVLWFGPELFCQSILMYLLSWFDGRDLCGAGLALVDPGDLAGRPGCSVSYLGPEELVAAFAARRPIGATETALASRAWQAYAAPDPSALADLASGDSPALPHLGAALRRHLEEFPERLSGLGASERRLLEAVAGGARGWAEVYQAMQRAEARPWMTDGIFFGRLHRLSAGPAPLLCSTDGALELTERGATVLAGRDQWHAERWCGGVRIDAGCPWRWDAEQRKLVSVAVGAAG